MDANNAEGEGDGPISPEVAVALTIQRWAGRMAGGAAIQLVPILEASNLTLAALLIGMRIGLTNRIKTRAILELMTEAEAHTEQAAEVLAAIAPENTRGNLTILRPPDLEPQP